MAKAIETLTITPAAAAPLKWAKLFEVNGQQALFYLEPDGDDQWLHQCVQTHEGIHVDMKLIFPNDVKDNSRKAFDMVDQDAAERLVKLVRDMLDDVEEGCAEALAEDEAEEE